MAEPVNPMQTPQPPSNTAPLTSTPAQTPQIQQIPSPPLQQTSTTSSSTLPPQQPQPQPSQSPAPPTMNPSIQPTSTTSNNNLPNPTYPTRAPPGAPGRNYLNTHLAPYLRTGMNNILDIKPQYPLRWLGEYLISQSLIHEGGTDEMGVVERFIYEEHGVAVKRARPDSTVAVVQGVETNNEKAEDGNEVNGEGEKDGEDGAVKAVPGGQGVGLEDEEDTEMGGS